MKSLNVILTILVASSVASITTVLVSSTPPQTPSKIAQRAEPVNISFTANKSYQNIYGEFIDSVVAIKTVTTTGSSQGTGWLYSSNGYIVTNHHVIENAIDIEVQFHTGHWAEAKLIGSDVYSDIAVLKVPETPDGITPLPLARDNPHPGQRVFALGNPYGLEGTMTHGIISGVNRTMTTSGGFTIPDTIQTDAPINPGNSGGPLITANGVVVGVNRAKQGDNIGFAISPAILNRVIPSLIANSTYEHPYLGIGMRDVSPRVAAANDLEQTQGVLVTNVHSDSPATGKLQGSRVSAVTPRTTVPVGGDVIISIDNQTVASSQALTDYLATETSPGETVTLTVIRDGERQTIAVTLAERPAPRTSLLTR